MMKHYLLLVALLAIPALFFAQNFKGLKTVGNAGQLSLNFSNGDYSNQTDYSGSFAQVRLGSPSFGKFVGNRLLIGGQLLLDFQRSTQVGVTQVTQPFLDIKDTEFYFLMNPFIRYYLKGGSKYHTFGQLQAGTKFETSFYNFKSTSQKFDIYSTDFDVEYLSGTLGINKPIDTYIYNESTVSFTRFHGFSNLSLNYGLRSFMPTVFSKKNEGDTPQYLAKGRSVYEPGISLKYEMDDYSDNNVELRFSYLQAYFLTDRIAVGGRGYLSTMFYTQNQNPNFENKTNVCFHLNPLARYYLPLGKAFYVYPEIGMSLYYDNLSQNRLITNYKTSVGLNYFVNKNVAYDFSFYWYSNHIVDTGGNTAFFNTGISLGVTYFIDKVKL